MPVSREKVPNNIIREVKSTGTSYNLHACCVCVCDTFLSLPRDEEYSVSVLSPAFFYKC